MADTCCAHAAWSCLIETRSSGWRGFAVPTGDGRCSSRSRARRKALRSASKLGGQAAGVSADERRRLGWENGVLRQEADLLEAVARRGGATGVVAPCASLKWCLAGARRWLGPAHPQVAELDQCMWQRDRAPDAGEGQDLGRTLTDDQE